MNPEKNLNEKISDMDTMQKITVYTCIVFLAIIVVVTAYFELDEEFQNSCLKYLDSINAREFEGMFWLFLIGIVVIFTGFPLTIYELAIGFILKDFWFALLFVSIVKIIGFTSCFLLARHLFREKIEAMLTGNIYFDAIQKAATFQPYRIVTVLKVMLIPTPIKTYGIGVLNVTFFQFFLPTVWTSPVLASVRVWMGTELQNIYQVTKNQGGYNTQQVRLQILMIVVTALLFWYCMYLTKNVYDEIIEEAEKRRLEEEEQNEYNQNNQIIIHQNEETQNLIRQTVQTDNIEKNAQEVIFEDSDDTETGRTSSKLSNKKDEINI